MSELRERIIKALQIPREKATRMGYKNAKGALDAVSASFMGTTLNEGVRFFDRTTVDRGKNEISQGGETVEIRFSENSTSDFKEKKLSGPAISFFAERIIHYSNYNAIVDTLGDFYEIYEGAASANPGLDFGALIGDAVVNPGDTPGSLKLDVLYFKNQTMGSLREKAAGFEDSLHYMFGNQKISEVAPTPSGVKPLSARNPAQIAQDEVYYSPIEVFIRDVAEEAIRSWGTDDERVKNNIRIAVRRAVREGLERGNERANAINNINMACDDVLAVFPGLTRENYPEKMKEYIRMVTNKPELKGYLMSKMTPLPSQPIPAVFLKEYLVEYNANPDNVGKITGDIDSMTPSKLHETYLRVTLNDYFNLPENAGKKPDDFDTLTTEQLERLAETNNVPLPISNNPGFTTIEYACSQSAMYGEHLKLAESEKNKAIISTGAEKLALNYWAKTYGITLHETSPERDTDPAAIRAAVEAKKKELERQRDNENNRIKKARIVKQLEQVTKDLELIDGPAEATQIKIVDGKQVIVRPPQRSVAIMNANDDTIKQWDAYTARLGAVAPKNDAMLLMTCCCILYDLNLNKLGGEILTANEVLERLGYDKVAGGIKYDGEQQKQVLSILNNLFYLNEEQRVNLADGGVIHQTIQRFQNFVYQMYDKYADSIGEDAAGNPIYPPGKLPLSQLKAELTALGLNQDSPFFGRGREILEQFNAALTSVKEGYAINNFNPVKACFAQMDPRLKDLGYRKMIMDYYKKEGLLPAKAVTVFKIHYKLDDEYKPAPIINPPPVVDPQPVEGVQLLDYCEEVGKALAKEENYAVHAMSKDNRTDAALAASQLIEVKLLRNLQRVYGKCEQQPQMFLYLTDAIISGKTIVDSTGAVVAQTSVNKNGGMQVKVLNDKGEFVTFRLTADQRLMFSKFAPLNGPMVEDRNGNVVYAENGLKKYFDEIQAYNGLAREIQKSITLNPNITEEELKAEYGFTREELKAWYNSLKFGGDYSKGVASSIFPKGMNPGVKLAFSLLTPKTFAVERDADNNVIGGRFVAELYGVKCVNMQHYARLLTRVGAQVDKDMKAIMASKNFQMFGSLMHLRVIEDQFVFAPAYNVGPKGGLELRDTMDVNSNSIYTVPRKMEAATLMEENPMAKIYVFEGGKAVEKSPAEYNATYSNEPLVQLENGLYVQVSQINLIVDVLAAEAQNKKRTIGMQAAGGGKIFGLAERMDIVQGLHLDDPNLITADVPAPPELIDPNFDGVIPSDNVSST